MCLKVNILTVLFSLFASVIIISGTPLTCQNIHTGTVSLPTCKLETVSQVDNVEYVEIKCAQIAKNNGTGLVFKLRILENTTFDSEKDKFIYCAGFETISSFHVIQSLINSPVKGIILKDDDEDEISPKDPFLIYEEEDDDDGDDNVANQYWHAEFNGMIATSSIIVDKTCIVKSTEAKSCTTELRLKPNIFDMTMLHYKITKKEFWNFDDPLFDADEDWLRTFSSHGYKYDLSFLKSLGNTSLQELKIVDNVFVTDEVFLGEMPRLSKFHFQDGYLSSFNSGNCKGKENLTEISLSSNNFPEIPPRGLSSCQELRILDLSNQDTVKINKEELSGLLKLEELNFSKTEINMVESEFLPPLPNLKSLNLSSCGITNISAPEPFSIFPKLEILDLSHNFIVNLDKLFIKRSNLKVLNISNNYRISLSNLSIANQDMKILDLSKNGLTRFPPVSSCKIEVLNLAKNYFHAIENLSGNNVTVNYLDLSDSTELKKWTDKNIFKNKQFQNISKHSFEESRAWVRVLKLTGTSTNDFTNDMTSSMNFLSEVDLEGMHITCNNCSSPFIKWLNSERSTKVLHLSSERPLLMCSDKKGITVQRYREECLEENTRLTANHSAGAGGNVCFTDKLLVLTFILVAIELQYLDSSSGEKKRN